MPPKRLPSDKRRDKQRPIRLTEAEFDTFAEASKASGKSETEIMREGGLRYARHLIKIATKGDD